MERVAKFLKEAETYYLATVEGDQPRVRPFGTVHIFEGKLYIQTGKVKDVSKQIHANPKVEICAFKNDERNSASSSTSAAMSRYWYCSLNSSKRIIDNSVCSISLMLFTISSRPIDCLDRKSTRLNSSHRLESRMPASA